MGAISLGSMQLSGKICSLFFPYGRIEKSLQQSASRWAIVLGESSIVSCGLGNYKNNN